MLALPGSSSPSFSYPGPAGCGVSGFMTASTAYVVDVSNPLNRARSMAPLFSAFSAGATAGAQHSCPP
eukprot:scaffold655060_cov59-Prasinocladus_malaysianus.AAC.1